MSLGVSLDTSGGCWICGAPCVEPKVTCSDDHHEELIHRFELNFGVFKRVTDLETGTMHKVPLRDIIEKGIRQEDLKTYPEFVLEES